MAKFDMDAFDGEHRFTHSVNMSSQNQ